MNQPGAAGTLSEWEEFALPHITVGILDGLYKGALAYALRSALQRPATIVLVSPQLDTTPLASVPLDLVELMSPQGDGLVAVSTETDVLVIEVPQRLTARLTDPRLVHLRRQTKCLLVEVDSSGQVVRASGPVHGMFAERSAISHAADRPTIVVGIDGSDEGAAAVEWAKEEANHRGALLRMVAAYSTGTTRRGAEQALHTACGTTSGLDVECIAARGEAVDALVTHSAGAELLVVGGHHTSGMIHSAMGGVGDSCARLVECPVVIVPSSSIGAMAHTGMDQVTRVPPPAA